MKIMPGTGRALCELFGDDRGFPMRRLHNLHVSIGCVHHGRRIGLSGSRAAGVCESWSARGFPRTDARPSSVPTVTFQTARGARHYRPKPVDHSTIMLEVDMKMKGGGRSELRVPSSEFRVG